MRDGRPRRAASQMVKDRRIVEPEEGKHGLKDILKR